MAKPDIDYDEFIVSVGTTVEDCSDVWFSEGLPSQRWAEYELGGWLDEWVTYRPGPGPKQSHVYCMNDALLAVLPDGPFEGATFEYGRAYTQFLVGTVAAGDVIILRLLDWAPTE